MATLAAACSTAPPPRPAGPTREVRERAYRANNVGVALLEQLKYPEAAVAFRDALGIDNTLAIGHFNLALALMYEQDLEGAAKEAADAARRMPDAPGPPYVLALVARALNKNDEARAQLEKVRAIDAADIGATVNLAQIDLEDQRFEQAAQALQPIVAREPYHVTASYVLGLALTRGGKADEGQALLQRAQELRRANYAVTFGTGYLEQGRYAEAIASTGAEPELVDQQMPKATFAATTVQPPTPESSTASPFGQTFTSKQLNDAGVRGLVAALGGGQTLIDIDNDGTLELVVVSASGQQVFRRDGSGAWSDATEGSGLETMPSGTVPTGVVSADMDNDGAADLYVLRNRNSTLYKNDGKGHFTDVTKAAKLPSFAGLPRTAAFVDIDHDGDVDLLIGGITDLTATRKKQGVTFTFPTTFEPAPLQLLRNNGNGTFANITKDAALDAVGHFIALVPTDFDNHRDMDLLVVSADAAPRLLSNQRDGTFKDVAADTGLAAAFVAGEMMTAVASGDANKDDWPDFLFARSGGAVMAMSDGHGRFNVSAAPDVLKGATAAQFLDYDNDGLLDIVALTTSGPVIVRDLGHSFVDVTQAALGPLSAVSSTPARTFSAADVDGNGAVDLVGSVGSGAWVWRNSGDARNHSLQLQLKGRVTNRLAIGSKVQVRAGSLSGRVETSASSPAVAPSQVVFGLGPREGADVVRILWPSGILQAETAAVEPGKPVASLPSPFVVEELDRKPSSCPFLFVWNGERFEFVTDFLGGGEMGYWEAPGRYNHPDPLELVRIRGDQVSPVNGRLQLRVTNELEEVLYLDRMRLTTVAHPADVEVYPNEGMTASAKPSRLHGVRTPHAPAKVTDDHGHDVTSRIAALDRRYPDDFAREAIRGYAKPHALTIDLGAYRVPQTLLLTAWTDYAFSSDNVAATQAGLTLTEPMLEARGVDGRWRRLDVGVGVPVGRPQTIPIDLGGVLRPGEHELRLSTSMRIFWDQIQVGDTVSTDAFTATTADPLTASLRARGFSAEVRPDGEDPPAYDYTRVSPQSPWKQIAGAYTREGDVLPLVTARDDQFVIGMPGDEVALEFAAPASTVPPGWRLTYLLEGDGYSKEMDVNSASPDTVEPLPFHGMSGYPYPSSEHYPDTPDHRRYRETYNTRQVHRSVPRF